MSHDKVRAASCNVEMPARYNPALVLLLALAPSGARNQGIASDSFSILTLISVVVSAFASLCFPRTSILELFRALELCNEKYRIGAIEPAIAVVSAADSTRVEAVGSKVILFSLIESLRLLDVVA
jgi:hypothetical protein